MVFFSLHWRWSSVEHSHSLTVSRAENVVERKRPWLAFQSGKRSVGSMGGLGWDLAAFPNQLVCARMCALPKGGCQCALCTVGSPGVHIHLCSLLLASTPTNQSPLHWSAQQTWGQTHHTFHWVDTDAHTHTHSLFFAFPLMHTQ